MRCSIRTDRCQNEAQKDRQCDGHEDFASKIEHRNNYDSQDRSGDRTEQRDELFGSARLEWLPDYRRHLLA